jgi:hypothetical protein
MILGDGTEVRMGNTYGQGEVGDQRGSKEMDRCPLTGLAVAMSEVLSISLSEVQAQYFRGSDMSSEVDRVLAKEQYLLREDLQERERFDENVQREWEDELRSYREDTTF